jgi:hypothetical protein
MNKLSLILSLILGISAQAMIPSIHEIDVEKLFVIQNGFDSNDDIEITLQTKLPSACYKIHEAQATKISEQTFQIKVLAKKKDLSGCEVSLINAPVNVTQTISIGELAAGEYQFNYQTTDGEKTQTMKVKPTLNQTIDDVIYAPISNAFIPELIYPTQNAKVVLTGIFNNTCMDLTPQNIKVIKEDNKFIIIPKTTFLQRVKCRSTQRPIRHIISLGPVSKPGLYLVHVRSLSGLAVNKVFYVNKSGQLHRGAL